MKVAEAFVEIRAQPSLGFDRQVEASARRAGETAGKAAGQGVEKGVKDSSTRAAKDMEDKLGAGAKRAVAGIAGAFAAVKVGQFLKGAIDQASRLEQAVGATSSVFKEQSKQIDAFAKTSAQNLGLSEAATRELSNRLGATLKGMGFSLDEAADKTKQLVVIGADLAATFGGTTEEAVSALGAAFRGETDPLERFGVAINQAQINAKALELGLAANAQEVDANAKAQATLKLILERTADAQGQFAREADTAAGAQARARAEMENTSAKIGQSLLPVYARVQELIGTVAQAFGSLPGPVQTAVVALAGLVALSGPLNATLGILGKAGRVLRNSEGGFNRLAKAAGLAGAGLAVVGGAFAVVNTLDQITGRAEDAARALDELATAKGADALERYGEIVGKSLVSNFRDASDGIDNFNDLLRESPAAALNLIEQLEALAAEGQVNEEAVRTMRAAYDEFVAAAASVADKEKEVAAAIEGARKQTKDAAQPTEELRAKTKELGDAFDTAAAAADSMVDAIKKVIGPALSGQEAWDNYQASLDAVTQSLKDNGTTLDASTEKGRANRAALREVATAALEAATAYLEATGDVKGAESAMVSARETLIKQATQFGLTREEAEDYVDQLGLTPTNLTTTLKLAELERRKAEINDYIDHNLGRIPDDVLTQVKALVEQNKLDQAWETLNKLDGRVANTRVNVRINATGPNGAFIIGGGVGGTEGGQIGGSGSNAPGRNRGGYIGSKHASGPNKDTVPAMLTPGEFVVDRPYVRKLQESGLMGLLENRVPPDKWELNAGGYVPGYARGGYVRSPAEALAWARRWNGYPYGASWSSKKPGNGIGPRTWDCSGFMGAIASYIQGENPHRRLWSASQFPVNNPPQGFVRGHGPIGGFTIGVRRSTGGGNIGHTAGLLGGVGVEASFTPGVRVPSPNRPSRFPYQFHLPGYGGSAPVAMGPGGQFQDVLAGEQLAKVVSASLAHGLRSFLDEIKIMLSPQSRSRGGFLPSFTLNESGRETVVTDPFVLNAELTRKIDAVKAGQGVNINVYIGDEKLEARMLRVVDEYGREVEMAARAGVLA